MTNDTELIISVISAYGISILLILINNIFYTIIATLFIIFYIKNIIRIIK